MIQDQGRVEADRGAEDDRNRKLEAMGALAGRIAHDFNNLLTGITGNLSLAVALVPAEHTAYAVLERAQQASARLSELTAQLLTFSRARFPVQKMLSVAPLLEEAASGRCRVVVAGDLPPAAVDPRHLRQALAALVEYALLASPDGGQLELRGDVAADGLRITLSCPGVDHTEEQLAGLFDPLSGDKGCGSFGLAIVAAVVGSHGGRVDSRVLPGPVTRFEILLPAAAGEAEPAAVPEPSAAADFVAAGERILIMDDEDYILELLVMVLRDLGYDPTPCGSGSEAIDLYRGALAAGMPFRAVIMDLTVPGEMGGREAAQRLLELDPGARIIITSGYSSAPLLTEFRDFGLCGAICKPFGSVELATLLAEVLGRPAGGVAPRT